MNLKASFGKNLANKFFRRVDNVVWDLMTGSIGVMTKDNEIATLVGDGDAAEIQVNPFSDFGVAIPAFAQNTPVDQIKAGDLIYNAKKVMGWVVRVPNEAQRAFRLIKDDGTRGEWRPPKTQSLGLDLSGAMVLRSLVNILPGDDGLTGLQNNLLPLLMLGGESGDLEDMLPLLLFGGGLNTGGGNNNMLQTMMMMKMFSGKKTGSSSKNNPLSFFDN